MRTRPYLAPLGLLLLWMVPFSALGDGSYGLNTQFTMIPAAAFRPASSSEQFSWSNGTITATTNSTNMFVAALPVPNGAVLEEIRILITDTDPAADISASLLLFAQAVSGTQTCGGFFWSANSSGILGRDILVLTGSPIEVITRGICNSVDSYEQYYLEVDLNSTNHSLSGAVVVWHRQVSPAPVTATFNDVPTSDPFFRAIEALAASGITSGCGGGNFCPSDVVTRAQMAKFLANALGLHFPQ